MKTYFMTKFLKCQFLVIEVGDIIFVMTVNFVIRNWQNAKERSKELWVIKATMKPLYALTKTIIWIIKIASVQLMYEHIG